jgi:glycosyltransferase involved in cell wall biosynthesis
VPDPPDAKMRILFLTHYFHPEGNAPATRVYEMTRRWAEQGFEVEVVTGAPNVPSGVLYPGYRNRWRSRERIEGVEILRVWTHLAPNKGTVRRILNYLSFCATATLAGLAVRRPDLVIATSPQFFCGWAGVFVSRARRVPFVLEVRDLWPESIAAVGAMRSSWLLRLLGWLERRMYAAATRIVTVGRGYQQELEARGVSAGRISVIPNGVDRDRFDPATDASSLRARFAPNGEFLCSYVGTIGMGSGLSVVLRAAERLREQGRHDVVWLLVGDGAVREDLEREARERGLSSVVFTGRLPKDQMPGVLAASDACLVHLARRPLFRTVMPSKIFEAAAMAKPILLGVEGIAAEIVEGAGAGICIEPENADQLVQAVLRLASDRELGRRFGRAGYEKIAAAYDYSALAREYAGLIRRVLAEGARP